MKTWSKKLLSIICAVALVVTSVYVTDYKKAKAATATSEMAITTKEWGYKYVSNGGSGYINMSYTGVPSDYENNGQNFLNEAFAEEYITFGGGMTYADLIDGMVSFYVATNNILQFNWANRTNPFAYGWSFTIAKGALLPYVSTSGTSYMALDKEYTFTFIESTHGYDCEVTIVSCDVTTFSLGKLSIWGNGVSGCGETITITEIDGVSSWSQNYTYIHNDASYEDYVEISDLSFDKFDGDIKLRYILDGETTCFQMEEWGSLRTSMTKGDQLIFHKGLPIYFEDGNGKQWKALLDATYVYECDGPNPDNTQVFYGVKIDDSTPEYGLCISTSQTTEPQGNEQYINVNFDYATAQANVVQAHSTSEDILLEKIAEDYIQVANYTPAEASALGIAFRYIPNANVIQMGFGASAVAKLQVGDNIILKAGTPVVYKYNGVLYAAKLDAGYIFTVTANNGTNLTFSRKLYDTYTLAGTASGPYEEGSNKYVGLSITPDEFGDAQSRGEWMMAEADWKPYVTLSEHTYDQMIAGGVHIREYTYLSNVFQGIRFYSGKDFAYEDGEQLTFKKGFPVVYNTNVVNYSDGSGVKAKGTYLDKDYVFVYNASTGKFVYDASLGNTEGEETSYEFTITSAKYTTFLEGEVNKANLAITTSPAITKEQYVQILDNADAYNYVDIMGLDKTTIASIPIKMVFIPHANVLQVQFGADISIYSLGDYITLKAGLPVVCKADDGTSVTAKLTQDINFEVSAFKTDSNGVPCMELGVFEESKEYGFPETQFGLNETEEYGNILEIVDPTTKELTLMDDGNTTYYEVDNQIAARYVDYAGMTAEEMDDVGFKLRLVKDGEAEVLQVKTGSKLPNFVNGERIVFKKGLPLVYKTASGLQRRIALDKTYAFEVRDGNADYVKTFVYTDAEIGTWNIDYNTTYQLTIGDGEGYYQNIDLDATCEMMQEVSALDVTLSQETIEKYIDFAGLSYATHGFQPLVIITANDQVVQLRWGSAYSAVKEGDTITFKAGLPVSATTTSGETKTYKLESNVVFTIEKYDAATGGWRINGIQEVSTATPGDADVDFIQNVNDVNLLREGLAEIVNLSDENARDANGDGAFDSKDLVYAKTNFDIAESEANGTETYTLLGEDVSLHTIAASTNDTKDEAQSVTYTFNAELGTKNYLRLTYKTDTDLRGEFVYTVNGGSDVTEEFFLEAKSSQFEQFLDMYRDNGLNGFANGGTVVLKKIVLYNLSTTNDTDARLYKVETAAREVTTDNMVWAQSGNIKIGADLNMGGALAYMESLKYNVSEYRETGGFFSERELLIEIEDDYTTGSAEKVSTDSVNLINIYDWGRQIQQSYYSVPNASGDVNWSGEAFTYGSYNNDTKWPYNPVQAGDTNHNRSQIVDWRVIDTNGDGYDDVIYVKVRAMDWSWDNVTTDSYMENWYRIADNLVYVDNRFIDWSGFNKSTENRTQELPALYVGQSLHTLVSDKAGIQQKDTGLGSWTATGHYLNTNTTTDWYAFVNSESEDAFGVGIYIPNVDQTVAGRSKSTRDSNPVSSLSSVNSNANEAPILDYGMEYITSMYQHKYQNCFVQNTSYIAPVCSGYLIGYKAYEYTYVLTADKLANISTAFAELQEQNVVDNTSLEEW